MSSKKKLIAIAAGVVAVLTLLMEFGPAGQDRRLAEAFGEYTNTIRDPSVKRSPFLEIAPEDLKWAIMRTSVHVRGSAGQKTGVRQTGSHATVDHCEDGYCSIFRITVSDGHSIRGTLDAFEKHANWLSLMRYCGSRSDRTCQKGWDRLSAQFDVDIAGAMHRYIEVNHANGVHSCDVLHACQTLVSLLGALPERS